ncbi:hypothetical protein [Saccharothrix texasensis]|nr:hypothetical protein [Saccharothrix texasensis]
MTTTELLQQPVSGTRCTAPRGPVWIATPADPPPPVTSTSSTPAEPAV